MVVLEEDGYIHRPHVSAGGVPLDRGYRQFVSSLDPDIELDPVSAALVDREFGNVQSYVEEWMDSASVLLAGLLSTLAFTTVPRTAPAPVKSVELLQLQETGAPSEDIQEKEQEIEELEAEREVLCELLAFTLERMNTEEWADILEKCHAEGGFTPGDDPDCTLSLPPSPEEGETDIFSGCECGE